MQPERFVARWGLEGRKPGQSSSRESLGAGGAHITGGGGSKRTHKKQVTRHLQGEQGPGEETTAIPVCKF